MAFFVKRLRQAKRAFFLIGVFIFSGLDFLIRLPRNPTRPERARWLMRTAAVMCRAMGFRVTVVGEVPRGGFIAPNHLSYVDILVLASLAPQAFLSRQDVEGWPVIGAYTRMAGTLYIDRKRRSDVAKQAAGFAEVMAAGLSMTFFLEGTSSDGRAVLPFRASLLQPLVENSWPVTPAFLRYECEEGDVAHDVCWWGDMGFFEHMWRMFKVKSIRATVVFGKTRQPGTDRKQLGLDLYQDVLQLSESH